MRGMEEMVDSMRNVGSKYFLPTDAKYSAQGISLYISKKGIYYKYPKLNLINANLKCKSWWVIFLGVH